MLMAEEELFHEAAVAAEEVPVRDDAIARIVRPEAGGRNKDLAAREAPDLADERRAPACRKLHPPRCSRPLRSRGLPRDSSTTEMPLPAHTALGSLSE